MENKISRREKKLRDKKEISAKKLKKLENKGKKERKKNDPTTNCEVTMASTTRNEITMAFVTLQFQAQYRANWQAEQ